MDRLAIIPGVSRTLGRGIPVLDPELRQKVFERDDHTCRYCGFQAKRYQEINFISGQEQDVRLANLATACIFCHQCFVLDRVSMMRSGIMIWLPEMGQAELNHLARSVYVARVSQGPAAEASRRILDILMRRREDAKKRLGGGDSRQGSEDPQVLACVLREYLTSRHYAMRDKKLEGIRLFPLDRRIIREGDLEFNQFPQILAYWRSKDGPYGSRMPQFWVDMYKRIKRAAS